MKKVVSVTEVGELHEQLFKLGFTATFVGKKNENGPDMWLNKKGKPYSLEIKTTRRTQRGSLQCKPVEPNRVGDDLIAIKINDYWLIEPMEQHLKCVTAKGYRTFTGL